MFSFLLVSLKMVRLRYLCISTAALQSAARDRTQELMMQLNPLLFIDDNTADDHACDIVNAKAARYIMNTEERTLLQRKAREGVSGFCQYENSSVAFKVPWICCTALRHSTTDSRSR
jgi:hypothetical protein